ncbi:hypothetical protein, partial [Sulfitobacter sp. 1A09134]
FSVTIYGATGSVLSDNQQAWMLLSVWMLVHDRSRIARSTPWIALLTPLILVTAMAFGFRQNVPNRGGLLFSQIEYHYYVTLRPLWRD